MNAILEVISIGLFATAGIDAWGWLLKRTGGIRSLDYCLLGRWALHMPSGRFVHSNINAASPKANECHLGWSLHYGIGLGLAALFTWIAPATWLERPTLWPALTFGLLTVIIPFSTLQPAFGLGFASSKASSPFKARLKSLSTHAVFGLGLFASAWLFDRVVDL